MNDARWGAFVLMACMIGRTCLCASRADAKAVTCTDRGEFCKFPFVVDTGDGNPRTFNSCTSEFSDGAKWCATRLPFMSDPDSNWAKCVPCNQACTASYGASVGDAVCCGQQGTVNSVDHVCPKYAPVCIGFVRGSHLGSCQAPPTAPPTAIPTPTPTAHRKDYAAANAAIAKEQEAKDEREAKAKVAEKAAQATEKVAKKEREAAATAKEATWKSAMEEKVAKESKAKAVMRDREAAKEVDAKVKAEKEKDEANAKEQAAKAKASKEHGAKQEATEKLNKKHVADIKADKKGKTAVGEEEPNTKDVKASAVAQRDENDNKTKQKEHEVQAIKAKGKVKTNEVDIKNNPEEYKRETQKNHLKKKAGTKDNKSNTKAEEKEQEAHGTEAKARANANEHEAMIKAKGNGQEALAIEAQAKAETKENGTKTKAEENERMAEKKNAQSKAEAKEARANANTDEKMQEEAKERQHEAKAVEGEEAEELQEGEEEEEEEEDREEGEEGEEEEEEEEPPATDQATAFLLMGCVVFVMSLFLASNMEDEDMRLYVWRVISATISIFVAVLVFTSVNALVHEYILKGCPESLHIVSHVVQFFIYTILMQFTVARCSGSLDDRPLNVDAVDSYGVLIPLEQQRIEFELAAMCWATVAAHTNGFAAIVFGAAVQREMMLRSGPISTFFCAPIMFCLLLVTNAVARFVRYRTIHETPHRQRTSTTSVEKVGEQSYGREWAKSLCESEVYDAEVDVAALCVSFLTVQALRFAITNEAPKAFSLEPENARHENDSIMKLFVFCIIFAMLAGAMIVYVAKNFSARHALDMKNFEQGFRWKLLWKGISKRVAFVAAQAMAMCTAWCFFFGLQWQSVWWFPNLGSPGNIRFRLVLALGTSAIAFCITLVLDKIADARCVEDDDVEEMLDLAIIRIIDALSISVGFSWEQSFDGAVEVMVEVMPCPPLLNRPAAMQFVITILITGLVTYAWRKHILVKVYRLQEARKEKKTIEQTRCQGNDEQNIRTPRLQQPRQSAGIHARFAQHHAVKGDAGFRFQAFPPQRSLAHHAPSGTRHEQTAPLHRVSQTSASHESPKDIRLANDRWDGSSKDSPDLFVHKRSSQRSTQSRGSSPTKRFTMSGQLSISRKFATGKKSKVQQIQQQLSRRSCSGDSLQTKPEQVYENEEYSEIVDRAQELHGLRCDCWDAFVFVIFNDLPDFRKLNISIDALYRSLQVILCYVLNAAIQGTLLYYIYKELSLPSQLSAQNLYKKFHEDAFEQHEFSRAKFDMLDFDTKESLCQLSLVQKVFNRVILFLWITRNVNDFLFDLARIGVVANLPALPKGLKPIMMVEDRTQLGTNEVQHCVVCADRATKITTLMLVYIPKLVISVVLTSTGCIWLLVAERISDLILNSMALAFVTGVDELIAQTFFPSCFTDLLAPACWAIEPPPSHEEHHQRIEYIKKLCTLIVVIALCEATITFQSIIPNFKWDVAGICQDFKASQYPWCAASDTTCFPKS